MAEFKLQLEPAEKIVFSGKKLGDEAAVVSLKITNPTKERVAFKVKCTSNELFRIRPPVGALKGEENTTVTLTFNAGKGVPDNGKHYFAVYYIKAEDAKKPPRACWAEHKGEPDLIAIPWKLAFQGTARYCSSNAHSRIEVGRNDDLWSLLYVLLEMYNGFLPWREMNRDDTERYKRENEKELFAGCPREFELAMKYVKTLTYSSTPNYKLLRNLLCSLVMRECASDKALDWEPTGKHGEDFAELLAFEYLKRKQPGEKVDLIKILKLPESIPVINDNDFDNAHNSEKLKTNSDNDDTIEGSEKTTKEKTISLNIPYGGYQYRPKGKDANKTKNSKPSMEYTRTTSGETTGGAEQKTQKYD